MLTNIILLTHSFIPHNHNHEIASNSRIVILNNCNCDLCSHETKLIEESLNENDDSNDEGCGCCNNGEDSCSITLGYFNHTNEESLFSNTIDFSPYILHEIIDLSCEIFNKKELECFNTIHITQPANLHGIGMRAPPVFIS